MCLNVIESNVMIIINNFNLNPNPNPNHVDGGRWCEVVTHDGLGYTCWWCEVVTGGVRWWQVV